MKIDTVQNKPETTKKKTYSKALSWGITILSIVLVLVLVILLLQVPLLWMQLKPVFYFDNWADYSLMESGTGVFLVVALFIWVIALTFQAKDNFKAAIVLSFISAFVNFFIISGTLLQLGTQTVDIFNN